MRRYFRNLFLTGCGFLLPLMGLVIYVHHHNWFHFDARTQLLLFVGMFILLSGFLSCLFTPLWFLAAKLKAWFHDWRQRWQEKRALRRQLLQQRKAQLVQKPNIK